MFVSYLFISLLLASSAAAWAAAPTGLQRLTPGNSIAVEDVNHQFLISPNGTFSSGFYRVGNNSYCYSIWYTNSFDKTVVWMANRDKPVNGEKSKLTLNVDSNLVLTDADGTVVWSSDTVSNGEIELRLLETGNLVVKNQSENFIWQSFDSPLDTLLPDQRFLKTSTLISMQNRGTYLSGFYYFKFNDFNVLNLLYNSPSLSGIYWPDTMVTVFVNGRSPYNSSRIAILNNMGGFESSDKLTFNATDYGVGPKRRLTIDYDGVLRLYSLDESTGNWTISWLPSGARIDACMVHGLCGEYGICEYDPLPTCTCPSGFLRIDPSDWTKGCKPLVNLTCDSSKEMDFIALPNTDYFGYDWAYKQEVSLETCRNLCLSSCECTGFGYALDGTGQCYPKIALRNGYRKPNTAVLMFIKATKGESLLTQQQHLKDLNCSASQIVFGTDHVYAEESNKFRYMGLLIGVVVAIGISELIFVGFGWWNVFRKKVNEELVNMGYIVLAMGFKRFSYSELKRATKNFKQEIGKGGFGTVYKGELDDGRVVAVKRLDGVLQGDAEFWAEVSIIGKINHKNLVKLWGFCAEKHHKMLVYEYVQNGSLDKLLFSDYSSQVILDLEQRYEIAVGTAKGLSYLHEECLEWVLHCDVKPQNILLDEALEPKVADFGMSKLFREINESGFSKVRGTRGYLAPEWMMNLKIDAKADVYSYGIVLLELISGKNAYGFQSATIIKDGGSTDLVKWIMKVAEKGGVEKVMDPRLKVEDNQSKKKVEILLKVALLCVREDRNMRPAMSRVVELLTGYEESSPYEHVYDPKK